MFEVLGMGVVGLVDVVFCMPVEAKASSGPALERRVRGRRREVNTLAVSSAGYEEGTRRRGGEVFQGVAGSGLEGRRHCRPYARARFENMPVLCWAGWRGGISKLAATRSGYCAAQCSAKGKKKKELRADSKGRAEVPVLSPPRKSLLGKIVTCSRARSG
jgi:hypothetical protein